MTSNGTDAPTPAEWKILRIVSDLQPCATREVLSAAETGHGWSSSTAKTLLRRLVEKGHLTTRAVGNTFVYRVTGAVRRALRQAANELLENVSDGSAGDLLAYMVRRSQLSATELDGLRELLEREEQRQRGSTS